MLELGRRREYSLVPEALSMFVQMISGRSVGDFHHFQIPWIAIVEVNGTLLGLVGFNDLLQDSSARQSFVWKHFVAAILRCGTCING